MPKFETRHGYKGLLIVVEGTDGAGKSTQINMLKRWIEDQSYGAMVSEWKTSRLIGQVIDDAKERNLLNATTFSLLYAADFADRMTNSILPALEAGFVVLMDRYKYTAYARDVVRGHDIGWVRKLYDFAPQPDLVFYLDIPVEVLLKRIIGTTGLDYYESGRDIGLSRDFYKSFKLYQSQCLEEYRIMSDKYGFIAIDGTLPPAEINEVMRTEIQKIFNTGQLS